MISLHPLFSDGAVVQQKAYIPIFGKTSGNAKVKAELAGVESCTKSTSDGKFILRLPPVTAGGPYTLNVTNLATGEKITVKDILAGEVWVASGQSNMAYLLGKDGKDNPEQLETRYIQAKEYCDTVKNPSRIRFTVVPKRVTGLEEEMVPGKWLYMNRENAPEASAVAAWFAKYVQEKTDLPIGLIISAYGGTFIESWTSRSGLLSNPETADLVNFRDQLLCDPEVWERKFESPGLDESFKDPGNRGMEWGWEKPDFNDSSWAGMKIPGSWLKQKISGNGALWVSARTLNRLCMDFFNGPPVKAFQHFRAQQIQQYMLEHPREGIKATADRFHFSSTFTFSRFFSQHFGYPPSRIISNKNFQKTHSSDSGKTK